MGDAELAKAIGVSKATVYNARRRYLALGAQETVNRKARKDKGVPEKVDGRIEAHIVALACSATPNEEPVWTLTMLADKLVTLELVDSMSWPERTLPGLPASREKVRQV